MPLRWLVMLWFCVAAATAARAQPVLKGVTIGNMTTMLYSKGWTAFHMADDLQSHEDILFSTYGYLGSLAKNGSTSIIVGSAQNVCNLENVGPLAQFCGISGFHQINSTHIIVTDFHNHCIRLIVRPERLTKCIAGRCGISGYKDGSKHTSLFHNPQKIINGRNRDEYYITDRTNNAIRQFRNGNISTLTRDLFQPIDLILNKNKTLLFVVVFHGLVSIDILSTRVSVLTSLQSGNKDGKLITSMYTDPWNLALITSDLMIITERGNNKLRAIDLAAQTVTSICRAQNSENDVNNFASIDGDAESCYTDQPHSVYWSSNNKAIIVGTKSYIRKLSIIKNDINAPLTSTERYTNSAIADKSWMDRDKSYGLIGSLSAIILLLIAALLGSLAYYRSLRNRRSVKKGRRGRCGFDPLPPHPVPSEISTIDSYGELPPQGIIQDPPLIRQVQTNRYSGEPRLSSAVVVDCYLEPRNSRNGSARSTSYAASSTEYMRMSRHHYINFPHAPSERQHFL